MLRWHASKHSTLQSSMVRFKPYPTPHGIKSTHAPRLTRYTVADSRFSWLRTDFQWSSIRSGLQTSQLLAYSFKNMFVWRPTIMLEVWSRSFNSLSIPYTMMQLRACWRAWYEPRTMNLVERHPKLSPYFGDTCHVVTFFP